MKELNVVGYLPKGFKFVGTIPRSIMSDQSCLLIRFDIEREKEEFGQPDPYTELKAQFLKDEEGCKCVDGLFAIDLYQYSAIDENKWHTLKRSDSIFTDLTKYKYRHHPHADKFIEYLKCSDEDKERWEWRMLGGSRWYPTDEPMWNEDCEYRLPPKPFFIGKYKVPPPVTEIPEIKKQYWFFRFDGFFKSRWDNLLTDKERFEFKLIRLTESEAQQCYEVLIATLSGN